MAKVTEEFDSAAINLIGAGTTITGDINSNGDIRINGQLTGNLSTKGRVIIGETGKIKGEINCKNADILGLVDGKLTVLELLTLKSSATVTGEVTLGRIAIEPGCKFNGTCVMVESGLSGDNKFDKKSDVK
jgi:cytoskeletal protein CcmA (bactofilin family)